ncbi:alpha/beta fold hydrolase [Amycolatopsis sp. H20-H5]|uniref:alpha/beta fold hydrolase n=1 Tax=Amycolatopsis sp. H20-H5 TaxID=3046309 RepID=UPI002DBC51A2|nr:hypothetical protein [Amycolatopsis sp. H20-H5]MEC3980938.1 hypothetical protein [Amycolatopsis sp. H20-H5]
MIDAHLRLAPAGNTSACGHALVFSPVLPQWDEGRFFAPVTRLLTGLGYHVTVVDTLSLADETMTGVPELAARWSAELAELGPVELLLGNALGGAVAQALAPVVEPSRGVALVSSPTRADPVLAERLTSVAVLAESGNVEASLALLERLVQPEGAGPPPPRPRDGAPDEAAGTRIARGMRLLLGLDLVDLVTDYPGPLLHVVGERSQLVTRAHVAGGARHEIVSVPGAGMRPHHDRPELVAGPLTRFAKENPGR